MLQDGAFTYVLCCALRSTIDSSSLLQSKLHERTTQNAARTRTVAIRNGRRDRPNCATDSTPLFGTVRYGETIKHCHTHRDCWWRYHRLHWPSAPGSHVYLESHNAALSLLTHPHTPGSLGYGGRLWVLISNCGGHTCHTTGYSKCLNKLLQSNCAMNLVF